MKFCLAVITMLLVCGCGKHKQVPTTSNLSPDEVHRGMLETEMKPVQPSPRMEGSGISIAPNQRLELSVHGGAYVPVSQTIDYFDWHDKTSGTERIKAIRARLKAITGCPWKSDGEVVAWMNGEQPGVQVRSSANMERLSASSGSTGGPVAEVPSAGWSGSRDPVADAEFIAHACEDIEYLLKQAKP